MKRNRVKIRCTGFTLVELLTTLAVIGILLGLLIPALNQVSKTATRIKQKAQFHALGTALESFRNDYGDYPPSAYNNTGTPTTYATASHHLAEAVVGRDGFGFHQSSSFRADGTDGTNPLYAPVVDLAANPNNLKLRKGPYLEIENANAIKLSNLYTNYNPLLDTYVLADMYKNVKHKTTSKSVGMPILYYKANKLEIGHDPNPVEWANNTYNIDHNFMILSLIVPFGGSHPLSNSANAYIFYNAIKNPNFPGDPAYPASGQPPRPYRAESFILHSAGPDGLYGTTDDIFNFETEK
ncbi:MAG: hypothetical protein DRP56_06115 [Planctomycetota bacterium]|nr:MAG: hypothetical protein DRP56_06115 [Planctomycetota bacterium]